jgi:CheY-like chemotaxis protein
MLIAIPKESRRPILMMVTASKQDMDLRRALNGAEAYVLKYFVNESIIVILLSWEA